MKEWKFTPRKGLTVYFWPQIDKFGIFDLTDSVDVKEVSFSKAMGKRIGHWMESVAEDKGVKHGS